MASDDAVVLALVDAVDRVRGISRARLADLLLWAQSPPKVLEDDDLGYPDLDAEQLAALRAAYDPTDAMAWDGRLAVLAEQDPLLTLRTVASADYQANLREVVNRPPFIFGRGRIQPADARSVAVVGTRNASADGLRLARDLATAEAEAEVTVVSGLASGIDAAGHQGALDAGGRTLAGLGHGLSRPAYPAENRPLAVRIVASGQGALVSHFTPGAPPTRQTFPMRKVITSALSLGTVVVEAGPISGAKHQAERCLQRECAHRCDDLAEGVPIGAEDIGPEGVRREVTMARHRVPKDRVKAAEVGLMLKKRTSDPGAVGLAGRSTCTSHPPSSEVGRRR